MGEAGLPVGVLGGVSGQSKMVRLAAGDLAVLVSDGLLVDGPGWVLKQLELSAAGADTPEQIAQTLVETARARADKSGRPRRHHRRRPPAGTVLKSAHKKSQSADMCG